MTQPRFPRLTPEAMTPAQREVAAEIAAGRAGRVSCRRISRSSRFFGLDGALELIALNGSYSNRR